ncbi:HEPN domain-containing protein [Neomoorella thermoacetica]|uniref:HEPN domain-containing protein n=1 Tax=Neomoorella thermoacetica TaxID=1525 RepID=UPI0030D19BAA
MKHLTEEWIAKAKGDYRVASREKSRKLPVYDAICFHAQQFVEKYMKAVLQESDIPFPKTHDLLLLLNLCSNLVPTLEEYRSEMAKLCVFAVNFRYPGEFAEPEDALVAYSAMKKIRNVIRKHFLR